MNSKNIFAFSGLVIFLFLLQLTATAQGVIVPRPCRPEIRRCPPIPRPVPIPVSLPVKSIKIETKIVGQVATTSVEQVFRNDSDLTLEGTYFFPIPETASITAFAIWENDKKLVGEVRSREEARRIYDQIVRSQRDPGLLEYVGKDLFQASIFPIPPRSDKKLELSYTQILRGENGTVSYRYPLGTGGRVLNPINIPWRDVERNTTVPWRNVEENAVTQTSTQIGTVSGRIEIEANQALRNIYSPTHSLDVRKNGENRAVLSFETSGNVPPSDFQLFYGLSRDDFGLTLLTYREPGKDGFFMLLLSPKDEIRETDLAAKDIVFVIDTSGSMDAEGKMDKAKAALSFGVRNLRDADRFNIISFAGEERLMESRLIAADAAGRRRGEEFVKSLRPTGGTNINDALQAAKKQFSENDRPKILVFLTDGLPTVGETQTPKIIANFAASKIEGLRLFNFGVGVDVNTQLLDKLATENGGVADYVDPKEDMEIKVSNFFAKVNAPVLTDLEINFGNLQTEMIYPRRVPDLFKGTQIALIGRYRNANDLRNQTIRLSGKTGKESRTFNYENLKFPLRDEENVFLPKLWATRRVGWLTEQIRNNGETKELRDEIAELGTRYGIVTPYTSYLAIENAIQTEGLSRRDRERNMVFKSSAPTTAKRAEVAGRGAVTLSSNNRAQQESVLLNDSAVVNFSAQVVRNVNNRTFYRQNNVWQDVEFEKNQTLPRVNLKFGSPEFFDLVNREKELAQYFALGENVTVVYRGKIYQVTN